MFDLTALQGRLQLRILYYAIKADISFYSTCIFSIKLKYDVFVREKSEKFSAVLESWTINTPAIKCDNTTLATN